MQFKQIYSLEEQQVIADDVMSACNRKPLAKYNIKQRSVARNLNALGKETSGRAGMRYGVYPFIYTEPYVEEGHVAATFALDTRQHLMTSQEFATKLFNELKSITKMIYTLGKNQTKEEIRHIDSIMLKDNIVCYKNVNKSKFCIGIKLSNNFCYSKFNMKRGRKDLYFEED